MTSRELLSRIRKIIYEYEADPDMIQLELLRFHTTKDLFTANELLVIIDAACIICGADRELVLTKFKGGKEMFARYFIWKFIKENKPKTSHGAIGRITGGQSSSTVLTGINTLNDDLAIYSQTRDGYGRFVNLISKKISLSDKYRI